MAFLQTENLSFAYPDNGTADSGAKVLDNINITAERGELILICGGSGSGKTTLLRLLKPVIAPFVLPAAVFIASAVACVMVAAAMVGSRLIAARCAALIISASSSVSVIGFIAMETTSRPLFSPQSLLSSIFIASHSSVVCAGTWFGRTSRSEIFASAGCSALTNSVFSCESISLRR